MLPPGLPDLIGENWNVICDFDGTITPFDVTDAVLSRFAAPEWQDIEEDWLAGRITAKQCMEKQVALLHASPRELDEFLDNVPLTPGFAEFIAYCEAVGRSILVVSDGLDYSIKRILAGHGLRDIPVIANRLVAEGRSRYRLEFPYGQPGCESGVCKCAVASALGGKSLLIGDGHSDCCLARNASFVLARESKSLLGVCEQNAYPHLPYVDFFDVRQAFSLMLHHGRPVEESAEAMFSLS